MRSRIMRDMFSALKMFWFKCNASSNYVILGLENVIHGSIN